MKTIPFVDLTAQYKTIKSEIDNAIKQVLESTQFILGEEVGEFEEKFAEFSGVKYAVGVGSGLSALELGMRGIGLKIDDEVITPVNSYIASSSTISFIGAKPVWVDCEEDSFNIDPNKIEEKISKKTKAIMVVHLCGRPADMDQILTIARKYNLQVLEDACQSHGAMYKQKRVGSFGIFGAFSFYPGKNLGAYGDGGIITTNDSRLAETLKYLRNYGQVKKYYHSFLAGNSRLDTIQAAILLAKLPHLDKWNKARVKNAKLYNELLKDLPVITPKIPEDSTHIFHLYVIRTARRDELARYLNNKGISTNIHYPIPIHLQKAYSYLGYKKGDFPVAEKLAAEILSIPMYPELKESQIELITDNIKKFFKS